MRSRPRASPSRIRRLSRRSRPRHERPPAPSRRPRAGLKKRVIPDPPEIDQSKGRQILLVPARPALAALLSMMRRRTLNSLADPYGMLGMNLLPERVTTSDRTIKADAIEALKQPPQLVVLGSSRSMRYEPNVPPGEDRPADLQRRRQRHRRHRRRLGHVQLHPRHLAGRAPRVLLAARRGVVRALQGPGRTANEPRLAQVRRPGQRRQACRASCSAPSSTTAPTLFSLGHGQGFAARHPQPRQSEDEGAKYRDSSCRTACSSSACGPRRSGTRRFPKSVKRYGDLYRNAYKSSTRRRRATSRRRSSS